MMDPFPTRFDGINYYVMYLEHYIVYFKVDNRVAGEVFRAIQLKPDRPLVAVSRELTKSKELQAMVRMVK